MVDNLCKSPLFSYQYYSHSSLIIIKMAIFCSLIIKPHPDLYVMFANSSSMLISGGTNENVVNAYLYTCKMYTVLFCSTIITKQHYNMHLKTEQNMLLVINSS